jgi:hypothetical protein
MYNEGELVGQEEWNEWERRNVYGVSVGKPRGNGTLKKPR